MGRKPIIREMRASEAGKVARMVADLAGLVAVTPRLTAEALIASRDLIDVVVAEEDGRLLGACLSLMTFSTWRGARGVYVVDLFVEPDARGRNVGASLLQAAASRGAGRGAGFIKLEVDHSNDGATRFYERHGFTKIDKDRLFVLEQERFETFIQQGKQP